MKICMLYLHYSSVTMPRVTPRGLSFWPRVLIRAQVCLFIMIRPTAVGACAANLVQRARPELLIRRSSGRWHISRAQSRSALMRTERDEYESWRSKFQREQLSFFSTAMAWEIMHSPHMAAAFAHFHARAPPRCFPLGLGERFCHNSSHTYHTCIYMHLQKRHIKTLECACWELNVALHSFRARLPDVLKF
jgi:hypothetical protein